MSLFPDKPAPAAEPAHNYKIGEHVTGRTAFGQPFSGKVEALLGSAMLKIDNTWTPAAMLDDAITRVKPPFNVIHDAMRVCKIDHRDPDGIPALLCRKCNPDFVSKYAGKSAHTIVIDDVEEPPKAASSLFPDKPKTGVFG